MKEIWFYARLNGSFVNDVVSLKKEIKYPTSSNMVKILYLQHRDIQQAIDETCIKIVDSVARLDAAALRLLEKYSAKKDSGMHDNIQGFIQGVRGLLLGQYRWAIRSPRYKICVETLQNGLELEL
jgi:hypothetical protein